jgi:hypothetical protein
MLLINTVTFEGHNYVTQRSLRRKRLRQKKIEEEEEKKERQNR